MSDVVQIPTPRPSSAGRWCGGRCPGSVALAARYPRRDSTEAQDGTRLHDVAAGVLQGTGDASPEDWKVVGEYVTDVRKEVERAGPGAELHVEVKRSWAALPELEGTPDASLMDPSRKRLIIWDLKTGWGVVEVDRNWQLLCYAVMLCLAGWTIDLRIVQPRPHHPDGSVRSWKLTWMELQPFWVWIARAFREATSPGGKVRCGAHCLYCEALSGCPAARDVSLRAVEYAASEPVDLPDEHLAGELRVLRETLGLLKLRTAALEEEAQVKLRAGRRIPGLALLRGGRGSIRWTQDDVATRAILKLMTGTDHAMPKMPTPTQLKDAGVSEEVIRSISQYQPGQMKVSTEVDSLAKKVFGDELNMEHEK